MNEPQIKSVTDPRDPLERLSRKELVYLARFEGRTDIKEQMPAELIKGMFRSQPPRRFPRPMSGRLGEQFRLRVPPYDEWKRAAFGEVTAAPIESREVSAVDLLMADWESQSQPKEKTRDVTADRNLQIYKMRKSGVKAKDVATRFNISAARVTQIVAQVEKRAGHGKNAA